MHDCFYSTVLYQWLSQQQSAKMQEQQAKGLNADVQDEFLEGTASKRSEESASTEAQTGDDQTEQTTSQTATQKSIYTYVFCAHTYSMAVT